MMTMAGWNITRSIDAYDDNNGRLKHVGGAAMENTPFCIHPGSLPRTMTILILPLCMSPLYIFWHNLRENFVLKKKKKKLGGGGGDREEWQKMLDEHKCKQTGQNWSFSYVNKWSVQKGGSDSSRHQPSHQAVTAVGINPVTRRWQQWAST